MRGRLKKTWRVGFAALVAGVALAVVIGTASASHQPQCQGHPPGHPLPAECNHGPTTTEQTNTQTTTEQTNTEQTNTEQTTTEQEPCGRGEHRHNGRCVANESQDCKAGEHLQNGKCVPHSGGGGGGGGHDHGGVAGAHEDHTAHVSHTAHVTGHAGHAGHLAHTGLDAWLIGLLGMGCVGTGVLIRRRTASAG